MKLSSFNIQYVLTSNECVNLPSTATYTLVSFYNLMKKYKAVGMGGYNES
jgi:hypothetical protein